MSKNSVTRGAVARLLLAAMVIATAACAGESADTATAAATAPAEANGPSQFLYVANQSGPAVSIIDMDSREVVETVWLTDLGFTPNAKPHHVAVEADGSFWYVSLITDGRVLKFDRDNNLVAEAEFETPGMLALDPVEDVLYVGRSMAAVNPPHRIGVVTRSDMTIDETDVFFARPHAIAAASTGGRAYSGSLTVNQVASVAPADDDLELVNVDGAMHMFVNFVISPDGGTLVTGGQMSGDVMVFDLADPRRPVLVTTLNIGGEPWHPVYSPDGRFVYFPQRTNNSVAVIDTAEWELVATIEGEAIQEPHGSAISPDGGTLWVSARNLAGNYPTTIAKTSETDVDGEQPPAGVVIAIDTTTREVVAVIEVPAYAAGMGTNSSR